MEFLKKTSEPFKSRKRSLNDTNDYELEDFRKPTTAVSKFPPLKIRTRVQVVRDFTEDSIGSKEESRPLTNSNKLKVSQPSEHNKLKRYKPKELVRNNPSFGPRSTGKVIFWDPTYSNDQKPKVTTTVVSQRKPLTNLDNDVVKMTSDDNNKLGDSKPLDNIKIKSSKPKEMGRNNSSFGLMPAGKVKYWDPNCSKEDDLQKPKDTTIFVSSKEQVRREKIKEALKLFDVVYGQLFQENKLKPKEEKIAHWRVPGEAAKLVKQKLKWMDPGKRLGPICGVKVGDKFKFRSQLQMVGLHFQPHSGIDYTKIHGKNLAISVVDSHCYSNESESCDTLIYSGQGGHGFLGRKLPPKDQKLERGNLALKNSMDEKTWVRVIRKVDGVGKNEAFVYDGLYIVNHCTQERSSEGKIVFKFQLNRVTGQPPLHKMLNASR